MQEADGTPHSAGHSLCAVPSDNQAKLQVGTCYLPQIDGLFSGPFWVLEYSEIEGYALISRGQPNIWSQRGCRTGTSASFGGLWVFSRKQERNETLVQYVRSLARMQHIDVSVLNDVDHRGCPSLDDESIGYSQTRRQENSLDMHSDISDTGVN